MGKKPPHFRQLSVEVGFRCMPMVLSLSKGLLFYVAFSTAGASEWFYPSRFNFVCLYIPLIYCNFFGEESCSPDRCTSMVPIGRSSTLDRLEGERCTVYRYPRFKLPRPMVTKTKETASEPAQIALFQVPELPEPFRKAVPAVHIAPQSGPISLQQAKMFNALIKNAIEQNKQGERVWFDYPVGQLINDVGLNSKNRDYVKSTINSLVGFVVNWDHLSDSREWNASGLVAGAKISGFSQPIAHLLVNT